MTDDVYVPVYDWCNPRPYHYYQVNCIVYNKYTEQYNSFRLYISLKKSLKWLEQQSPKLPSGDLFSYTYTIKEVEDREDIVFHHITTSEDWSRYLHKYFMLMCATSEWHISIRLKFLKFFNNWKKKLNFNLHKYSVGDLSPTNIQ